MKAWLYDMISTAMGLGLEEATTSFVVKHSFAISQLLSTKARVVEPSLIVNMGPYLSAKEPKVLCAVWEPVSNGK